MNKYTLSQFSKAIGLIHPDYKELKTALTHDSYKPSNNKKVNNNSRYVFLGMYGFKGEVASILNLYKFGTGQQLQHTLGNTFTIQKLSELFDIWNLKELVLLDSKIDIEKYKHIFVYAVLGFIMQNQEKSIIDSFILRYFINTKSLNEHCAKFHNIDTQLQLLCSQRYGQSPKISVKTIEDKYEVTISVNEKILSHQVSKSKVYARKKSIYKALLLIATESEQELVNSGFDMEQIFIKKNILHNDKTNNHEQWLKQQAEKKKVRAEKRQAKVIEAEFKDKRRKKLKEERRRKLEAQARINVAQRTTSLSASKRRFLEDKAK